MMFTFLNGDWWREVLKSTSYCNIELKPVAFFPVLIPAPTEVKLLMKFSTLM